MEKIPPPEDVIKDLTEKRTLARRIVLSDTTVAKLKDAGFVGAVLVTFTRAPNDGVWTMLNGVAFDGLTFESLLEPAAASIEVGLAELTDAKVTSASPNTLKH